MLRGNETAVAGGGKIDGVVVSHKLASAVSEAVADKVGERLTNCVALQSEF